MSDSEPRRPNALDTTPERIRQVELNRLRAKARQQEKDASAVASSVRNANGKRPLSVVLAASGGSPTAASKKPPPAGKLQRDSRLGKYFDYDLSKMVNSKGGFLVEDDKEADDDLKSKERERERQRAMQNLDPRTFVIFVAIYLDPSRNPKCHDCGSVDIDQTYRKVFRCLVCDKCKNDNVEKYSLLTKTECKEDYLLTDSELRDEELLPHMLKANPHKSTFANMMLFCRYQVEEFAWNKWGSPEELDAEWKKRTAEKDKKKKKKFEQGVRELRKRTREGVWQKRKDAEHKHEFGETTTNEDGVDVQVCHDCGFTIEVEEF
ncbi:hydrophilic protein [Lactarius akahatsu]|uniref:DNA repair protein RAD14 n=1 Tax=Lactarius akahatsu TaxID=416441 RepID=A0AAD4LJZ0_9AGAM|nr:hydrophilic protein [Lactarius akahatsu]